MTDKRKKATEKILKVIALLEEHLWVDKKDIKETNLERYTKMFNSMSDDDFDRFMRDLRSGDVELFIFAPNLKSVVKMDDIFKAADYLKLDMFEQVRMIDVSTGIEHVTPEKYLIATIPVRRAIQTLEHKRSIPDSDTNIDAMTGQVVRQDKAASISKIEAQVLLSKDLKYATRELMKYRGGDVYAYADMKKDLEEQGHASITLDPTGTVARASGMYQIFMKGMHLDINMLGE